jgi:predicted amidohydrolase YtcJ
MLSLVRAAGVAALAAALLSSTAALADGIIDNVAGETLDANGQVIRFRAMVVTNDGHVVRLLGAKDKRPDKLEWRLDMKGRVLLPGMIDAHGHIMELGFRALELDLSDTKSLDEAKAAIRAYAAANPDKKWILGGGWNQEKMGAGALSHCRRSRWRGA